MRVCRLAVVPASAHNPMIFNNAYSLGAGRGQRRHARGRVFEPNSRKITHNGWPLQRTQHPFRAADFQ